MEVSSNHADEQIKHAQFYIHVHIKFDFLANFDRDIQYYYSKSFHHKLGLSDINV